MPAREYPFIEIAVHPAVRERFATGAGLAIFSNALDYVYWANGAAARQFGYQNIYAFLEDEGFAETVLARQIAASAGLASEHRESREVVLRLGTGFRRVATTCSLERITLPDGEDALLLSLPAEHRLKDSIARAEAMIAGFDESETHVIVLDRDANALAQSSLYPLLGISGETLLALTEDAEAERSRLVKRQVATARGALPAAIAHLDDDLFLLFVVEPAEAFAAPEPVEVGTAPLPARADEPAEQVVAHALETPGSFAFDPEGKPVRFVWKMDAEGRFSDISPEFATAIGPNAADVIGRTFVEVATVFNLDPGQGIAELLARRDTWSGRTVFWPVQGEALTVPVELAALPTYSRDRIFDGFRGFGIARIGEAKSDPDRLGLALTQPPVPADETGDESSLKMDNAPAWSTFGIIPPASNDDQPQAPAPEISVGPANDDPFRGEVPALQIAEPAPPPNTDKVIDLETRRSRGREGLSQLDRAVFAQIGAELGRRLNKSEDGDRNVGKRPAKAPRPRPVPAAEPIAAVSLQRPAVKPAPPQAEHVAAVLLVPAALPASERKEPSGEAPHPVAERRAETRTETARAIMTRAAVDALPVALLVHRGDALLHANADFLALTGHQNLAELEEAGGLDSLFAEAERPRLEALAGTLALNVAGGSHRDVRARLQSVGWEDGHALMLALSPAEQVSAAPVPEMQDQRLRRAEIEIGELHAILETATDGVVILEENGAIRSMNRSASALFDYDADETGGKPFSMLFAHESQRAVLDYVASLTDNGVASVLNDGREVIGREASGGFIPLFMTIGRLGRSNGFCAVIRDITHFKRTEDELRAAKRAAESASAHKSEFLARVSHEIRTPLNAIIGFSEMMTSERFGPMGSPRYLEYAHDIGRSGRHVLDIVNDLLDISKIEAGEQEMDFAAVSLNEALAESVSLVQPQANGQRVIIRTSLSAALPDIVADKRSLRQIAINLLSNAIRFTPSGGQIVVSTAYDQSGRVVMRVRDTGVGMSRAELEQAMKPFRQGGTSASRGRGDGTGLGLPLTKAMVEANRAHFAIESNPGQGTLIEITFPAQRVLAE